MKFQPVIKWSGSKRALSEEIIQYFPKEIDTYYEPFCGGCSVLFQLLYSNVKVNKYICSDINNDLINLLNKIKDNPKTIYQEYSIRWKKLNDLNTVEEKKKYYYVIRDNYNNTHNIHDFMFLSRTSANGLIRYNKKGEFNAPFNVSRLGITPNKFKELLLQWSNKFNQKNIQFVCQDYKDIIPKANDYIFLDPPYANIKGVYFGFINYNEFWNWLKQCKCKYSLTFDGKRNSVDNTYDIPKELYSKHIYLNGKISGFKKIHKETEYVKESLYIK